MYCQITNINNEVLSKAVIIHSILGVLPKPRPKLNANEYNFEQ